MTIKNIYIKDLKKGCPKCEKGTLSLKCVLGDGNSLKYELECSCCNSITTAARKCLCPKGELHLALLGSADLNINYWLIVTAERCYTIESPKAQIPSLEKIPLKIKPLVEKKIFEFFQV